MEYIKMKGILYEQNLIRLVTSAPSPSYMFRADFLSSLGEGLAARKFQRFESKSLQPFPSADIKILYIIGVWGRWLAKQDGRGNENNHFSLENLCFLSKEKHIYALLSRKKRFLLDTPFYLYYNKETIYFTVECKRYGKFADFKKGKNK